MCCTVGGGMTCIFIMVVCIVFNFDFIESLYVVIYSSNICLAPPSVFIMVLKKKWRNTTGMTLKRNRVIYHLPSIETKWFCSMIFIYVAQVQTSMWKKYCTPSTSADSSILLNLLLACLQAFKSLVVFFTSLRSSGRSVKERMKYLLIPWGRLARYYGAPFVQRSLQNNVQLPPPSILNRFLLYTHAVDSDSECPIRHNFL